MLTNPGGTLDTVNNATQDSVLDRRPRPVDPYYNNSPEELRLKEEMTRQIIEQRMRQYMQPRY